MRYLVKAKVKPGQEKPLLAAIESGTLGRGSVAADEYLENMDKARRRRRRLHVGRSVLLRHSPEGRKAVLGAVF